MARLATGLFVLASAALVGFGWVADRGLEADVHRARDEAKANAMETARLAAASVGAALLSLERSVAAGRPQPGVEVSRLAGTGTRRVPAEGEESYDRLSRAQLVERLGSSRTSPSGLPEAVLARLALGDGAPLSLPGGAPAPDVTERLLAGALPVHADDLPTLARALGVESDPRVGALRTRLLAAPGLLELPTAPTFRREILGPSDPQSGEARRVEGWARGEWPDRLRYAVSVETLLRAADLPDDVDFAAATTSSTDTAADVPELPGLRLVAHERQVGILRVRALRIGLWLSVIGSVVLLVAVRRALAAQARATEQEKRFLASVTHELRTPLAALRLFGERLAEGRGNAIEYGALIAEESERLESLVERVLSATRTVERPSYGPADPLEIVRSALALVAPRAERRRVALSCREAGPLPTVTWDEEAVRRALLNLLDNAIRHGREEGHVDVGAFVDADRVCLSVTDDGPGIARREQRDVFARFARGRTDAPGTGLGLHFVEQVAHAHGGRVDLASEEGGGCVFTLRLPIVPPSAPAVSGERP